MLAFDQILADLETKLLQQCILQQGTLILIVKYDWISTLKFSKHYASANGDDVTLEITENATVTSSTSRVQQLDVVIDMRTTLD
ncbi:MAG: hypothetical protein EZS28_006865 [Streblomastix strix]|uniref:Uncharacterized protein n=1 Tax=Streblomastix strix TaxID=222440 RepID=A0A5J4WR97_9EUKA|nr:MAG: hypothetical protein EZS28_006865 [Streblomastix strix]